MPGAGGLGRGIATPLLARLLVSFFFLFSSSLPVPALSHHGRHHLLPQRLCRGSGDLDWQQLSLNAFDSLCQVILLFYALHQPFLLTSFTFFASKHVSKSCIRCKSSRRLAGMHRPGAINLSPRSAAPTGPRVPLRGDARSSTFLHRSPSCSSRRDGSGDHLVKGLAGVDEAVIGQLVDNPTPACTKRRHL